MALNAFPEAVLKNKLDRQAITIELLDELMSTTIPWLRQYLELLNKLFEKGFTDYEIISFFEFINNIPEEFKSEESPIILVLIAKIQEESYKNNHRQVLQANSLLEYVRSITATEVTSELTLHEYLEILKQKVESVELEAQDLKEHFTPIENLGLDKRTYNSLTSPEKGNLKSVEEIANKIKSEGPGFLLQIEGFGKKQLGYLINALREKGFLTKLES